MGKVQHPPLRQVCQEAMVDQSFSEYPEHVNTPREHHNITWGALVSGRLYLR